MIIFYSFHISIFIHFIMLFNFIFLLRISFIINMFFNIIEQNLWIKIKELKFDLIFINKIYTWIYCHNLSEKLYILIDKELNLSFLFSSNINRWKKLKTFSMSSTNTLLLNSPLTLSLLKTSLMLTLINKIFFGLLPKKFMEPTSLSFMTSKHNLSNMEEGLTLSPIKFLSLSKMSLLTSNNNSLIHLF